MLPPVILEFRRTHELATLLDLLQDNHVPMPPAADKLDELNPYAVEARYGTISPDGLDRVQTLTMVALVIEWAKSQLI